MADDAQDITTDVEEPRIHIDGRTWTFGELIADLTFREKLTLRKLVRESTGKDIEIFETMEDADITPGLVYLIRRRENPEYTYEQALDVRPSDLVPPPEKKKRPQKAASGGADSKPETNGTAGTLDSSSLTPA